MDPQLRARLWWTALLVLIALSGAGLAVAADRPHNGVQRPELTYAADREALPLMQSLADDLDAVDMLAASLSGSGRETLGNLQALEIDEMRAAIEDGDGVSADIASSADEVARARDELLGAVDEDKLGVETHEAFLQLVAAADSTAGLPSTWDKLSSDAERVAGLLDALDEHDATVFRATTAGRQSRWEDALRLLDDARGQVAAATEIRNALAASADVSTLDDLLDRYRTYDQALTALYEHFRDGGQQSGAQFRVLEDAVATAQAALPADTSVLSVIVAEAGSAPLTRSLLAIETIRGEITEAVAAVGPARMTQEALTVAALALVGGLIGLIADRVSVRWPAHEDGYVPRGVDWRTAVLIVAGAFVYGGLASRWLDQPGFLFLAAVSAALIVLLATDLDQKILPDWVTLPLIVLTGVWLVAGWSPLLADKDLGVVSGIAAGIIAPIFLFVTDRILRGDLGDGDLKLAVSVGLLTGISLLVTGLLIASILFSVVLLALIAVKRIGLRSAVPFGPVLIAAAFVAVLLG